MNQYAETVEKNNGYLYILRRTVPPWRWRENLDELVRICPKYGIDEVCIKIDTGTFTHYYPSFEWLENYRKILLQIKKELNEAGVNYSLNPNVTQGHGDRGRNICKQHPDWPMCTNPDGTHATDCACNIGRGWRDYIRKQWTIYAETRPVSIWMEDDLRTFNHGPAGIGCFCREHIRRFNERLGSHYTREELVEKIFASGAPDLLRVQWLEFLNEMTLEVMRMCEETVHKISPETIFGLMSSGPDAHVAEGRDWQAMYRVMSADGKYPVLSRPPLGNYSEAGLPGLCGTSTQILMTRSVFGNACIEEGEIENFPYTGYSKTNTFLCLQNSVAIGCGNDAVTLNLFDHCGTPMSATEDILQALSCGKGYLNTLKSAIQPRGKDRGVRVYFHPDSGKSKRLDARTRNFFGDVGATLEILKMLGIAATINEDAVTVLAGQSIRSAPDDEILRILRRTCIVASARLESLPFQQVEKRERLRGGSELRKILRGHNRRICKETVAVGIAHAVCGKTSGVRRCGNQFAAGTHAERRRAGDGTVCRGFRREAVFRASQCRRSFPHAVTETVDELLRMLNPASDLKSLQRRPDSRVHEIQNEFPRAVSACRNNRGSFQRFAVCKNNPPADIVLHENRLGTGAPSEFPAKRNDLVANCGNQQGEFVGTDMRMAEITDLAGSAEFDEGIKDIADAPVADPGIKFPVGPCSRAAFPEQEVALFVQLARGVKVGNVLMTAVHVLAAFQNDGFASRLRKNQRAEKPGGAGADHQRIHKSVSALEVRSAVIHFSRCRNQRIDRLRAILNGCDKRVNQFQFRLMAGVNTALENFISENIGSLDSAPRGNVTLKLMINGRGKSLDVKRKIFH